MMVTSTTTTRLLATGTLLLLCTSHRCWSFELALFRRPSFMPIITSKSNCHFLCGIFACCSLLLAEPVRAESYEWKLMNGNVALNDPISLYIKETNEKVVLTKPELIGVGGGGAVFAFDDAQKLLKVSWEGSSKSVQRECSTLKLMEKHKIEATEHCLGEYSYSNDDNNNRVMILVEPYIPDGVASVMEVEDPSKRTIAIQQIARTLVQMLAANIITIDVQPLISKTTGNVIFIDMTEAQELKAPFTFLAKTLLSSFANEMIALLPSDDKSMSTATLAATQENEKLAKKGKTLSPEAMQVLQSQTNWLDT